MIAGIGPSLVDYIHLVDKYPDRGEMSTVKKTIKMPGGAVTNVLYGLSKFGIKTRLYSTIGNDEDADFFIKFMKSAGVNLKLKVTGKKTGRVDIYVDSDGERTFFVHPNAAGIIDIEIKPDDFQEFDYFFLDPFPSQQGIDFHLDVAKKAKEYGKLVILNPGLPYASAPERLLNLLEYVDIMFISERELKVLGVEDEELLKLMKLLVVTMGEKGSRAISGDIEVEEEAFRVNVVDTTGAGDAFAAGFLFAYLNGLPLSFCLKTGNYVASISIQSYGGKNFPGKAEVERFIKKKW